MLLVGLSAHVAKADIEEVGRSLDPDDSIHSPPTVLEATECGGIVHVARAIPGALIRIYVQGSATPLASGTAIGGAYIFTGLPLTSTMMLEATQEPPSGGESTRSIPEQVDPVPEVVAQPEMRGPYPLFACGRSVNVSGLLPGGNVSIQRSDDSATWSTDVAAVFHGPARALARYQLLPPRAKLAEGELVRAVLDPGACGGGAPVAATPAQVVAPALEPLPPLEFVHDVVGSDLIFEGQTHVEVRGCYPGAGVVDYIDGVSQGGPYGFCANNLGENARISVPPGLVEGQVFSVTQELCEGPGSPSDEVTVGSCDDVPAATIEPPAVGDIEVRLVQSVPGATIHVFANSVEIGDGNATDGVINLRRPVEFGDVIIVQQQLGECISRFADVLESACSPVRDVSPNSPVSLLSGRMTYELETTLAMVGRDVPIGGEVHFPTAGGEPLDAPLPVALIMHGNANNYHGTFPDEPEWYPPVSICVHDLQARQQLIADGYGTAVDDHHLGLRYLAEALAEAGYLAVTIDASRLNCTNGNYATNEGADLFLAHANFWDEIGRGIAAEDPFGGAFEGKVDTSRMVLIGHSRGAQRVPVAVQRNANARVAVRAGIMLAPPEMTGVGTGGVPFGISPAESNYLILGGSHDADAGLTGIFPFFDRSSPSSVSAQMYIYGADHENFNTEWGHIEGDDGWPIGDPMPAAAQRALTEAYVMMFADWHVRGLRSGPARDVFRGRARLRGLPDEQAWPSYREASDVVLDDFENHHPFVSSRGEPVSWMGVVQPFEFFGYNSGADDFGGFNTTFRHWTSVAMASIGASGTSMRYEYSSPVDTRGYSVLSLRLARMAEETSHVPNAAGVGLYFGSGTSSLANSLPVSAVGVVPAPDDVVDAYRRTALRTLDIPLACLARTVDEFEADRIERLEIFFTDAAGEVVVDDISLGVR